MAKSKSILNLQGTIGGLTIVKSRAYGKHVRAARGTHKKAEVNETFKKHSTLVVQANRPAKIVKDALGVHLQGFKKADFWQRLVSFFHGQLAEKGVIDYSALKDFEISEKYRLDRFLKVQPEVTRDEDKGILSIKLSYPAHPDFGKLEFIDGYRLGLIAIYPDASLGEEKSAALYTKIIRLSEEVYPLAFELPMAARAKCCLLCLELDGCEGNWVGNTPTTRGIRFVWAEDSSARPPESIRQEVTPKVEARTNTTAVKFLSLEPFIPSGKDFGRSKQLFQELGFTVSWDAGHYTGFEKDGCKFILQNYDNKEFAENLMINVKISNAEEFWKFITEKKLPQRFGIRITEPKQQPYGKEVNLIDLAGVCWHFVE